jgi:hypothetical protein
METIEGQKEERLKHKLDNGIVVSGKYDLIKDNTLMDYKSTSAWSMVFGSKTDDWIKQLSIYRWLYHKAKDIKLNDVAKIVLIFRDWNRKDYEKQLEKNEKTKYPKSPIDSLSIELDTINDTFLFIHNKVEDIVKSEKLLDKCTKEERWFNFKTKCFNKCGRYCSASKFCIQYQKEQREDRNA